MTTSSLLALLTAPAAQGMPHSTSLNQPVRSNEAPFSHILSNEMAGRGRTNLVNEKMVMPAKAAGSAAKPSAAPSPTTSSGPAPAATAKVAHKDTGAETKSDTPVASEETKDDTQVINAAASADLLAMMAGMAQLASQAKAGEAAVQESGVAVDVAVDGAVDAASPAGRKKMTDVDSQLSNPEAALLIGDAPTGAADAGRSQKAARLVPSSDAVAAEKTADVLSEGVNASTNGAGNEASSLVKADFTQSLQNRLDAANAKGPNTPTSAPLTTSTAMGAVQSTLLQSAQALGQTTEKLSPKVGTAAWDQALGQRVVWMVAGGQQSASLTLNPPDLGPLQVVLNVTNAHADATFIAAQPEVRAALEAALPKLRDMLGDAGIQLGQASVNAGSPNQHGASAQAQFGSGSGRAQSQAGPADQSIRPLTSPSATRVTGGGNGLVDTFA